VSLCASLVKKELRAGVKKELRVGVKKELSASLVKKEFVCRFCVQV